MATEEKACRIYVVEDKGSASACMEPAWQEMSGGLWGALPEELVERVLLMLPPKIQAQFQAVCQKWRRLLTSPDFLHQSAWRCLKTDLSLCLANLEIASMRSRYGRLKSYRLSMPESLEAKHVDPFYRSWVSGFLCLWSYIGVQPCDLHISLVNPANRTWTELPVLQLKSRYARESIVVAPGRDSDFSVIVRCIQAVGSTLSETVYSFSVYCSKSGVWQTTSPPQDCVEGTFFSRNHFWKGKLYMFALERNHTDLMILSGDDGRFLRRISGLQASVKRLVEHQGTVYCVAGTEASCSIWRLNESKDEWTQVSVLPWKTMPEFKRCRLTDAVVQGDNVFITARVRHEDETHVLLGYELLHSEWKVVEPDVPRSLFVPRPNLRLSNNF